MTRKGQLLLLAVLTIVSLCGLAFTLRHRLLESWHLHRLAGSRNADRIAAIEYLGLHGSARTLEPLATALGSPRPDEIAAAAEALWHRGEQGQRRLVASLRVDEWGIVETVLDRLHGLEANGDLLLEVMAGHLERSGSALYWLSARPELLPTLETWFSDGRRPPGTRLGALRAISRIVAGGLAAPTRTLVSSLESVAHSADEVPDLRGIAYDTLDLITGVDTGIGTASIESVSGRPGDEVAVNLRGSWKRPLRAFYFEFRPGDASTARLIRTELEGTAAAGLDPLGVVAAPGSGEHGAQAGYLLARSDRGSNLVESHDEETLLARAIVKIDENARPGEYSLELLDSNMTTIGARSLRVTMAGAGTLTVLPRATPPSRRDADTTATPVPASLDVEITEGRARLTWAAAGETRPIIYRNGRELARPEVGESSIVDRVDTELHTTYSMRTAEGEVLARAAINRFFSPFHFRAELVPAKPGDAAVEVRVWATNSERAQGMSFGMKIDDSLARIREIREGEALVAAGIRSFMYQKQMLDRGETSVGMIDMSPPITDLAPGTDYHVATVVVDVAESVPDGTRIPVEFGAFGNPPGSMIFAVRGMSRPATTCAGAVLVGPTAGPEIRDARAVQAPGRDAILLSWATRDAHLLHLERNGETLATMPGDARSFRDEDAGPGVHRYRLRAESRDGVTGFPVDIPVQFP